MKPTLLIAEPDAELSRLFGLLAERSCLHHAFAHTGMPDRVDVLLIDPAMAGARELVDATRALFPDLRLVLTSIYPHHRLQRSWSADAFLAKPFGARDFHHAIQPGEALDGVGFHSDNRSTGEPA